jgi:hypothetical protein
VSARLTAEARTRYNLVIGTEDRATLGSDPSAVPDASRTRGADAPEPLPSAGAKCDKPQGHGGGAPVTRQSVDNFGAPIVQFQVNQHSHGRRSKR